MPDHFQFLHRSTHHWHLTTYSKCFVSSFPAYVFCSQLVRSTYLHSALPCNFPSSSLGAASGDENSIETVLHLTRSGASVHFDISLAAIDLIPIARAAKVHYSWRGRTTRTHGGRVQFISGRNVLEKGFCSRYRGGTGERWRFLSDPRVLPPQGPSVCPVRASKQRGELS